ncbi:MAG TPA: glycosyltransferase family 4 protein [Actinomycetota bacterium]|nr:glycosyltransferase family 4 protein [Actinomycetota bacterium]
MTAGRSLRIALLTYRGNPHSGGQGVYVRYLSRALAELGHRVEVFSGPPYPELDDGIGFTKVPSLDLYRAEDPFRVPRREEFQGATDVLEFALMCTAGFPEPLTFSLRVARLLRDRAGDFDVVHDNQGLGYGLLHTARRYPVVATVHHPVSIDRRLDLLRASGLKKRISLQRWYAFTRMQRRVARRLPQLIAVSQSGRDETIREFGVAERKVAVVSNGVDTDLFRPLPEVPRVPGRLITTASADVPLKGLIYLIEAVAKLRTEAPAELVVVGAPRPGSEVDRALDRLDVRDAVRFEGRVDWGRLVRLYAEAQVAVVPSLYEGFSLPAAEAMSCGLPLVATTGGALPEVTGDQGRVALLVPPADPSALSLAISTLLADEPLRTRMGAAGRARALELFSWDRAAEETVAVYERVMTAC